MLISRATVQLALDALTAHADLHSTMFLKMDAVEALRAALAQDRPDGASQAIADGLGPLPPERNVLADLKEAAARKWAGCVAAQRAGLFARAATEIEDLRRDLAENEAGPVQVRPHRILPPLLPARVPRGWRVAWGLTPEVTGARDQ